MTKLHQIRTNITWKGYNIILSLCKVLFLILSKKLKCTFVISAAFLNDDVFDDDDDDDDNDDDDDDDGYEQCIFLVVINKRAI